MNELAITLDGWVDVAAESEIVTDYLSWIDTRLESAGIVAQKGNDQGQGLISPRTFVYALIVSYAATVVSIFLFRMRRRSRLKRELREAKAKLKYLQDKLQLLQMDGDGGSGNKKEVRIFIDGAFDLMHYGHMNAFRLARSLGTHLIVGVNSDESITACKSAPLMNDEERLAMVKGCKFVDEVIPECPYVMSKEYLDDVMEKYKIDYVVHGDDPCIVDGKDVYAAAKEMGKYRSIPRTEGVSTTDIVGRMLIMSKEHHVLEAFNMPSDEHKSGDDDDDKGENTKSDEQEEEGQFFSLGTQSKFLTTSRMLKLFSSGESAPAPGMKVIYIDGSWDMFHPGHVSLLKLAKERGDFLVVGVHGDTVVNRVLGINLPLMNLHERVLSVLGCRFVDDVLIDAPYEITQEMISSLKIDEVLESPDTGYGSSSSQGSDRFGKIPKDIVHNIEQPYKFSLSNILERIQRNQDHFQARFQRKMMAERQFYEKKHSSKSQ
eukprot:CAMPEP_0198142054 /NCGR_PEP_ID=MMETSP1443-20131203/4952_1 /TAXON_ID=186043 /ORGANISM="Entomoneis sp., Strain CCMP2396" /LENGTH=489 /DNA_ID=CAMNT_0043804991 /DNA_START=105 /DNA_END=1574 /DNA_ORIENTATION=+